MKEKNRIVILLFLFSFLIKGAQCSNPQYIFKAFLKKRFSKTAGVLKISPFNISFIADKKHIRRVWNYRDLSFLEWDGQNKIKLHLKKRDVKYFGKRKKVTIIIFSPPIDESVIGYINKKIMDFNKGDIFINFSNVEKKLPFTLEVMHKHTIGQCYGVLLISKTAIKYKSIDGTHSFDFFYNDIKEINRSKLHELTIVTYKKSAKKIWLSQKYHFVSVNEDFIPEDIYEYMLHRVSKK